MYVKPLWRHKGHDFSCMQVGEATEYLLPGVLSNVGDVYEGSYVCHLRLGGHICQYTWCAVACKTEQSRVRWWHADQLWQSQNLMPMAQNPQEMNERVMSSAGGRIEIDCCKELVPQGVPQGRHTAGGLQSRALAHARTSVIQLGQQKLPQALGSACSDNAGAAVKEPCLWRSLPRWTAQSWPRPHLIGGETLCC